MRAAILMRAVMKRKYLILFAILFVCFSCAQKGGVFNKLMERAQPGGALFDKAEQNYRDAAYTEALALYSRYLAEYPKSELAPAALMKIGMIHARQKAYRKARSIYQRVILEYPDSYFARQVYGEILGSYYQQGLYTEAVAYARKIPYAQLSREQRIHVDLIVGDAKMALSEPFAAYQSFYKAFAIARKNEQDRVTTRLRAAIAKMAPADIAAAQKRLAGRPPAGYLLYQQGLNDLAAGHVKESIAVFNDFIARFPHHAYADSARQEITRLQSVSYFEGHTIGCLLPLSGKYQVFGQQALKGIELALAEFGRRRSINPPVQILIRDTGSNPEQAVKAVQDLVDKRVAAIVGPIVTAPAAAAAAQKAGVPIITLTQQPDIVNAGDDVFRNFLTPAMQMQSLVGYTTGTLGLKRFAVLYPNEPYGKTFLNLFWDELGKDGGTMVGAESYDPDETDFSASIKKLVGLYYQVPPAMANQQPGPGDPASPEALSPGSAANPDGAAAAEEDAGPEKKKEEPIVDFDALFIPDSPQKAGLIISQLRYYDVHNIYLLGTNLWHSEKLIRIAGSQVRQAVIPDGFFADSRRPNVVAFVNDFKKTFGYTPGFIEAVSYDSAMILFETVTRPDVRYRAAVQAALVNMAPYAGVTGETTFDKNGDAQKTLYLLKVVGNHFEEISR